MLCRHAIAARLAALGFRVVSLPSCVVDSRDYLFYGCGFTVATCDSDFAIRMQQLPRTVAAEIESYLIAIESSVTYREPVKIAN